MPRKHTRRTALCGVFGALAVVLMLMGGILPLATFIAPALAGLCVVPVAVEFGLKSGILVYLLVSALSGLFCPDIEAVCIYIFLLGYYPLLKVRLDRIRRRPLRVAAKLVLFNCAIAAMYTLLLVVFPVPVLQADAAGIALPMLAALLIMGNVTFFIYDAALCNVFRLYICQIRPRLLRKKN